MQRLILASAIALSALPAQAESYSVPRTLLASPSTLVPFSAKDSFGQPTGPVRDVFPGDAPTQNVEFEIRGDGASAGPLPGVTVTATRSLYPTPSPIFKGPMP